MISNSSSQTDNDRMEIYIALGGYTLMKVISAFDVGIKLSLMNQRTPSYSLNGSRTLINFSIAL